MQDSDGTAQCDGIGSPINLTHVFLFCLDR